jgi:hypothetical protein
MMWIIIKHGTLVDNLTLGISERWRGWIETMAVVDSSGDCRFIFDQCYYRVHISHVQKGA